MKYNLIMPNGLLLGMIDKEAKDENLIEFSKHFPAFQKVRIEKIKTTKKDNKEENNG